MIAKNFYTEATFKKYRPCGYTDSGQEIFELVLLNQDYASMRSDQEIIEIIVTVIEHHRKVCRNG